MDAWKGRWMAGCADDGWMGGLMDVQMDGWINAWMDECAWMDGLWANG